MNARDIIEQIEALPKSEQAKVVEFIVRMTARQRSEKTKFNEAADSVFTEHKELMRRLSQ